MNALLFTVIVTAWATPPAQSATGGDWQPFTSIDSRLRFEMPMAPKEEYYRSPDGEGVHIFACTKDDVTYQAIAVDLNADIQTAIMEAVSDAESTVGRQILNQAVEGFIDGTESKVSKNDYARFQKFPSRSTVAEMPGNKEARLMSVLAKSHLYLFVITAPKAIGNDGLFNRFLRSVQFRN